MDQEDQTKGASSGVPDVNDLMNAFNCLGTDNKEDLVAQFMSLVPNLRSNIAAFYLEANNWNLQLALNAFMDTQSVSTTALNRGRDENNDLDEEENDVGIVEVDEVDDDSEIEEDTIENVLELLNQLPSGQITVCTNAVFQLAWQLRNIGPVAWPIGSQIIWTDGTYMGKSRAYLFESEVQPGQIVEISFELQAPPNPGLVQTTWHLAPSNVEFYCQKITTEFNVTDYTGGDGFAQTQNTKNDGQWMANSSGDNTQLAIPNSDNNDNEADMS